MKIQHAKRIVIKIGSAQVIDQQTGHIRSAWLKSLFSDIAALKAQGKDVVLVSSGAVAMGKKFITHGKQPLKLEEKQAAAACGQIALTHTYQQICSDLGFNIAQVLLTIEDSEDRRRYLNARSTLTTLLENNILPIINENDTVATEELRFGDNDRLAARVAQMVSADVLILLSDIDGLYTANPHKDSNAKHIDEVADITPAIEAMAGDSASAVGTGGMVTKIAAAKIATHSGCNMVIMEGKTDHPIKALENGIKCTWFTSKETPHSARKHWIAHTLNPAGKITIDDGAVQALHKGKSLLPAGVVSIKGVFHRGDALSIVDKSGKEIARGLSAYFSEDAARIIGHKSNEIESILGYEGRSELVHRDDLVMVG